MHQVIVQTLTGPGFPDLRLHWRGTNHRIMARAWRRVHSTIMAGRAMRCRKALGKSQPVTMVVLVGDSGRMRGIGAEVWRFLRLPEELQPSSLFSLSLKLSDRTTSANVRPPPNTRLQKRWSSWLPRIRRRLVQTVRCCKLAIGAAAHVRSLATPYLFQPLRSIGLIGIDCPLYPW